MIYDPLLADDLRKFAKTIEYSNAEINYSELALDLHMAADIVEGKEEREYRQTWKYFFKYLFKMAFSFFLLFCAFVEIYRFLEGYGLAKGGDLGDSPSGLMMLAAFALLGGTVVLLSRDDGRGWLA
jgi:hypothetical protein